MCRRDMLVVGREDCKGLPFRLKQDSREEEQVCHLGIVISPSAENRNFAVGDLSDRDHKERLGDIRSKSCYIEFGQKEEREEGEEELDSTRASPSVELPSSSLFLLHPFS